MILDAEQRSVCDLRFGRALHPPGRTVLWYNPRIAPSVACDTIANSKRVEPVLQAKHPSWPGSCRFEDLLDAVASRSENTPTRYPLFLFVLAFGS